LDREQGPFPEPVPASRDRDHLARPRRTTLQRVAHAAGSASLALAGPLRKSIAATVIPGKPDRSGALPPLPGKRRRAPRGARAAILAAASAALLLALVLAGMANRSDIGARFTNGLWVSSSGIHVEPTPIGGWWDAPLSLDVPPPPEPNDAGHYVAKYGFDWPSLTGTLSSSEHQRLANMLPFAVAATARWDARFGDTMEPQMLLYWTHSEGISGRVNYSNCANEGTPAGTSFFTWIGNCDTPSFWQLGYGNQFSVIAILKTAFIDMHGDPNDPYAVQKVGQAVLNWDRQNGTLPACGGYSCTFPAMTIDQIMAGVSLDHATTNDWWASVLSRDPGINCYMLARALVWFSHDATRNWVGCYYAEPCWSYESNSLGDILANWDSLRKSAGV
jgi:hypothetical protein